MAGRVPAGLKAPPAAPPAGGRPTLDEAGPARYHAPPGAAVRPGATPEIGRPMRKIGYVGSLLKEVFQFARQYKAYWLIPFVLILGLVILLVVTSQASAPFIYTLF